MSREVRMVPADWRHPTGEHGTFIPLLARDKWTDPADVQDRPDRYMPEFGPEATHYQMYECTSEGTPISPPFATPEGLARWLADTGASAFGGTPATYEQWLATIRRGWAVSAVFTPGQGLRSGVEAGGDPR